MFAVPGWDLRAESLVKEKPSAKAGRSRADPHLSNKRKRTQWEAEHGHSLDDYDLDKRWNQRFGNDASQGLQKGILALARERKLDLGPDTSNSRGTPVTPDAKSGDQESTPSSSNGRISHGPEDKLSRKQKKLWNRKQREQQADERIASDPTACLAPDDGVRAKSKQAAKKHDKSDQLQSSEKHVLQDLQGQSMSNQFLASGTDSDRKRESVLQDPKPYPFRKHADTWLSPGPILGAFPQLVSSAKARASSSLPSTAATSATTTGVTTKLTPLQSKFAAKLTSARFRHLNQQLYTTPSIDSLQLFKSQPSLFTDYHLGFTQQTQSWPVNPVNIFITALQKRLDLPRRKTGSCTIADLGCGDAPLARAHAKGNVGKKLGLRIHSFDLHAVNEHVTVTDIANLPLRDGEADIAIFCLSLMGTNWLDFVEECWRVLRGDGKGEVWVAEVKSRFVSHPSRRAPGQAVDNSVAFLNDDGVGGVIPNDTTDINIFSAFISVFQRRGFKLKEGSVDSSNKMFVSMTFYKSGVPVAGKHKGLKWNGKEYQTQNHQQRRGEMKTKFTAGTDNDDDNEVDLKEEAAVLKPCVYKTR
ncbi:hypothetical protein DV736_g680, partial [Chaetothyriales sp. CBS 134916]